MAEPPHLSEIVPGRLLLGDAAGAADMAALSAAGVTHVLNCTASGVDGSVPCHHEGTLQYHRVQLLDRPSCLLLPLLEAALEFARAATEAGGVVFAHCHAGSSRSGAVVCAYLMQSAGLTYDDAFAQARARRSNVKPNAGFRAHLRKFQGQLAGLDPAPVPNVEELEVDAQEFADAEMGVRLSSGAERWDGYGEYKAVFLAGLQRAETDWVVLHANASGAAVCGTPDLDGAEEEPSATSLYPSRERLVKVLNQKCPAVQSLCVRTGFGEAGANVVAPCGLVAIAVSRWLATPAVRGQLITACRAGGRDSLEAALAPLQMAEVLLPLLQRTAEEILPLRAEFVSAHAVRHGVHACLPSSHCCY